MSNKEDAKVDAILKDYSEHVSEMNLGQLTNVILNLEGLEAGISPQEKAKIENLISEIESKRGEEFEDHKFPFHKDTHLHKMLTESEPADVAKTILENTHTKEETAQSFQMHESDMLRNTPRELWANIAAVGKEIEKQTQGHATGENTTRRLASQFVEAMNMLSSNVTDKQLAAVLTEIPSNLVDAECKAMVHTVKSHSTSTKSPPETRSSEGLTKQHTTNESLGR